MLLLHGSTGSTATWWQVGEMFADNGCMVTALDLPSHGASPRHHGPLLRVDAAAAVAAAAPWRGYDLVVGHSFGAAVALHLLQQDALRGAAWMLEELPRPTSVDWAAEAIAVRYAAETARGDPAAAIARTRAGQDRWRERDCEAAVAGLLACDVDDVAAGLDHGGSWWTPSQQPIDSLPPVLLLLAPDAAGVNVLEDATALRGPTERPQREL